MRVISGEFKGRKLISPKGTDVRPTADRVKEAIFSMVWPDLPGAHCLDLFAGSGALGIEALSRGASRVVFCDASPSSLAALRQNLETCRIDGQRAVVIARSWRAAAAIMNEKCNLVFIDAPYNMWEHYSQILECLMDEGVLEEGALIVIERAARAGGYSLPAGFAKIREKRYGSVGVDLLVYTGRGQDDEKGENTLRGHV